MLTYVDHVSTSVEHDIFAAFFNFVPSPVPRIKLLICCYASGDGVFPTCGRCFCDRPVLVGA